MDLQLLIDGLWQGIRETLHGISCSVTIERKPVWRFVCRWLVLPYFPSSDGGVGAGGIGGGELAGPVTSRLIGAATVGIGTDGVEAGGNFTWLGGAGGVNIIGVG